MIRPNTVISAESSQSLLSVELEEKALKTRKSKRPLAVLILLIAMVCAMAGAFHYRASNVVRAAGALYPLAHAELRAPTTQFGQSGCRVAEIFKRDGDLVAAGEPILRLSTDDEILQREQSRRQIASLQEALKDHQQMKAERKLKAELAALTVHEAAAEIEIEQARLDAALALLKRAGSGSAELEVNVAREKLRFAEQSEENCRKTFENHKALPPTAISDEALRTTTLEWEKAKSRTQQARDELELLKKGDVVAREEAAQAEVAWRRASLKTSQARKKEREKEVQLLELALNIDTAARLLEGDLDRLRLEEQRLTKAIEEKILRAPLGGMLHDFQVQLGQWVINRQALGWIYDTSSMTFCAQVPQSDLGRIQSGQRARVYFNSHRNEAAFEAEVIDIAQAMTSPRSENRDPLSLLLEPVSKVPLPPRAVVRLRLLRHLDGSHDNNINFTSCGLRVGFSGQARILIGSGELAEWLY